jgi:hypothetical protein
VELKLRAAPWDEKSIPGRRYLKGELSLAQSSSARKRHNFLVSEIG